MSSGIFIVGTDTDVGKTYVSARILKQLRDQGIHAGYYKAVLSGGERAVDGSLVPGDAKEVLSYSGLVEAYPTCVSYTLENPLSPHLAAKLEGVDICLEKIKKDYDYLQAKYDFLVVEGSGGVACPIKLTEQEEVLLTDIIKLCDIAVVIVARAGLGTINHTVLTVNYLQGQQIPIKGIILNNYEKGNPMHEDNRQVIERLTNLSVIGTVGREEEGEIVTWTM